MSQIYPGAFSILCFFFLNPEFSVLGRLHRALYGQLTMHSTGLCRACWGQPYDIQCLPF